MVTPPIREPTDATTQHPKKPVNWGCIALGGCLGLAAILLLNPISLMVIGMAVDSHQTNLRDPRNRERLERVCHEVEPAIVARIEAGLKDPDWRLVGARAVHTVEEPESYIAAEVQGIGYEDDGDIAVWHLNRLGISAFITGVNELALQVSHRPRLVVNDRPDLADAAEACTAAALAGD